MAEPSLLAAPTPSTGPLLRYPAALMAFVVAVVALALATLPADEALLAGFAGTVLVVISAIDLQRQAIPNRIVLPATGLILVAQIALFTDRAPECILAALCAALVFMIPQLLNRAWMGAGDVKLALLLGATLGWGVFGAVLLAFLCVFPVALLVLLRHGSSARNMTIPFGPFLSLGALIVLLGPHIAGLPTS